MPDPEPVFPCLKEPDWPGSGRSVCRRLWTDVESPHIPWLAFGYDQPHTFAFLNRDQLPELNKTERDIEREALRNLRLRKATWQPADVKLGFFKKLRMLISGDDYFSAEKLLDVGFMREAQRTLKAEVLAVGIPRRGFMIATDGKQPMEILGRFAAAVSAQFHRGDSPPITPAIFAVMDGKIIGMLQGGEGLGRPAVEQEAHEAEESEDAPYVQGMVLEDEKTGLEEVHICAGGANLESLADTIQAVFQQTLQKQLPREEFGGGIQIVVLAEMTPEAVRAALPSLVEHLQGVVNEAGLKSASGHPVKLGLLEHGGAA